MPSIPHRLYVLCAATLLCGVACGGGDPNSGDADNDNQAEAESEATAENPLPFDPESQQLVFYLTVPQAEEFLRNHPDIMRVDVRDPETFATGHLPGSRSVDVRDEDFQARLGVFPREDKYLIIGDGAALGAEAIHILSTVEFRMLYHLNGGFAAWQEAGLPVETGPDPDPLPVPPPPEVETSPDSAEETSS